MRSILVEAGRDPGMEARLDTALALARCHDAHVTALIDTPVDRYVTTDPYGGTYFAREALEEALAADDDLAERLKTRLVRDDVPFDLVRYDLSATEALAQAGRLADLIIVSRAGGMAGDLALAAPCPVLALPDGQALSQPVKVACIAWDGGDEAAAALKGAVPLLRDCASVHLLTVVREQPAGFPATDAARYLARYGIKCELHELALAGSIEETLASHAAQLGAGLFVMGAYSKSRLREFLFGGVTRYFLDHAGAPPLLLAH